MAIAMLHRSDPSGFDRTMTVLLANASPASASLNVAALAILELDDLATVRAQVQNILSHWKSHNLFLGLSALGNMIDAVELPAAERLRLIPFYRPIRGFLRLAPEVLGAGASENCADDHRVRSRRGTRCS